MIAAPTAIGWYLYGIVAGDDDRVRRVLEPLQGVGGCGCLTLLGAGPLVAVAGPVPLDEFGDETLPALLDDRAWLERAALAHEQVLEHVAEAAAVVPLRFGSVHLRSEDVEALLRERGDAFAEALARVRGRVELGVKAWLEPRRERSGVTPPSGRAYLERLREERRRAADASGALASLLAEAHERLLDVADAGVVNRPQPRELTGREEEMVLNAAYLVAADDERLILEVAELDERHRRRRVRFEVTGPWPPYNFVDAGSFE